MAVRAGLGKPAARHQYRACVLLKGARDKTFLEACRAHGADDARGGRVLSFFDACQVRPGVRAPVAGEDQAFLLRLFRQRCVDLRQDLLTGEVGHLDRLDVAFGCAGAAAHAGGFQYQDGAILTGEPDLFDGVEGADLHAAHAAHAQSRDQVRSQRLFFDHSACQ